MFTNSIEGFWAHFKRVVFSTYHIVSKDYLQRYIDEQVYRWNTREKGASYRFGDMFNKAVKRDRRGGLEDEARFLLLEIQG